jgi:hypothetical protein
MFTHACASKRPFVAANDGRPLTPAGSHLKVWQCACRPRLFPAVKSITTWCRDSSRINDELARVLDESEKLHESAGNPLNLVAARKGPNP